MVMNKTLLRRLLLLLQLQIIFSKLISGEKLCKSSDMRLAEFFLLLAIKKKIARHTDFTYVTNKIRQKIH